MKAFLRTERQKHWAAALSVLAFLSLMPVVSDSNPPARHQAAAPEAALSPGRHAVLGDSAIRQQYGITVNSIVVGQTDQASQTRRITVNLTVTNLSDQRLQVSPGLEMHLQASDGTLYPMTAEYLTPGAVVGGPVDAKRTGTMDVDFKLPASAALDTFVFQPDAAAPATKVSL